MKTVDLTRTGGGEPPSDLYYEALSGKEGILTRALWEQVFPEDTEEFLRYYFREKITDARIHVLKDDKGRVVSMVHANPYEVMIHGVRRRAYYIVGVATSEPYRHRGCMAFLLQKAVLQAKSEGCPFVFLMPADAAIYEPFGFRYAGQHSIWARSAHLKERMMRELPSFSDVGSLRISAHASSDTVRLRISAYSSSDAGVLAAYAEKTLAERYDTYCVHDEAYFERLSRELASENGGIYLLWRQECEEACKNKIEENQTVNEERTVAEKQAGNEERTVAEKRTNDTLCGYFCYACEGEEYLQEVIVDREAEALFYEKSREERIMFLSLEGACAYGRTYFPEMV
ncbi:MAG: GNAT family N-acetyltransferase [Lachnospiraceae bacterium]|nr:GNAT family N-acetyltransferase [Lachnospiraceae bacterium]